MNRDAIISQLFNGKNLRDCISKMEPAHLREDLRQEVAMVICSLPDEQLTALHRDGKIEFYTVRVIINMMTNKYSPFYKTFRSFNMQYVEDVTELYKEDSSRFIQFKELTVQPANHDEQEDRRDREIKEQLEAIALEKINTLYWYDKEMILLYMKHGNFRALEAETKIPFASCYKSVKKALKKLKEQSINTLKPVLTKEELARIQNGKT